MFLLLYILIEFISACPYYCDKCDELTQSCESCNSQRELIIFESNNSNQNICQCNDHYIDVGGNQCLQCANNCIKCQQNKPSYCLYCGDVTKTHRVLDENNKCICENGYYEVWFTYNCQNQQYDNQILQFIYILQQKQYIERLQQRYNYTEQTIAGINYMINRGVVNDSVNTYQYIHTINQNEILNLDTPYSKGQYYAQQFDNLYTLGIKLNLKQGINWMAHVEYYGNPQYFKSSRTLYEQWSIGIFQFQLINYPNQIFLQIAISENKNVASQNRLLNQQDSGNMTLFYYLGYNVNRYLEKSELDLIINDILFIMIEKQKYVNQYSFDGLKIVTESCIDNYQINNADCVCPIDKGYYFYETVCYQLCPENCLTCTKEVCIIDEKTKICRDGYYQVDKSEFECDQCKQECVTCLNLNQCIKCQTQHINIDGSCITCAEYSKTIYNCKIFDENCQCIECLIGFQLNTDNICINCPITCKSCQFQDQCIICIDGYYLNNYKCDKCQNNCLLCQEYNICTQAEYGYFIDYGIVQQCPNKCQNYKENCLCVDCPILYYLQESTELCQNCVAPCEKCLNVNTCINCISEEYYYNNGKCVKCQEPCLLCKSQTKCITCINDEYYFDDVKEFCYQCTSPCKTCIYQQKQQQCKTCIYKHYIYLTQCLECPKYCLDECYFDELNNFVQCKGGCVEGYYQDQLILPFQCIKCSENCLTCQSQDNCVNCIQGSTLKDKQCHKCNQLYSEYCIECNQESCIKCLSGYEIKDKICSQIIVIVVPSCDKNYQFYNDITNTCDPCISNCYQCQNQKFCSICIDEYFEDQGTCIKCLNPCKNCKSLKYCLTLTNQNYYINSSITDIQSINYEKCQSPCKTCISQIDCIECIDGYLIQNEKCVECDKNCKTCTNSSQQCTSCPQGYKLNDSVCIQCLDEKCQDCLDKCIQCNHLQIELYKCFACLPGYVLIENECIKCSDSCKTCQDTITKCSSCPQGFYLTKDMICEKCDEGCIDCQIQTKSCTTCQTGLQQVTKDKIYYYCIKCPSNCKECISETECKICDETTFLNDKFMCEKCITPCKSCVNKDECINCIDGYYFNENKCQKCTGVCLQCTSANDCSQCPSNYYLKDNNCELCPLGCSTCIDQNTCTKCDNGYYLDGICIQCTENCLKCQKDKCEICENNYKLSSDNLQCQQKICVILNCQQCDNDTQKCLICNTNFILDENGLQCTTELTQNEIPQDQVNQSEGGSSLIYIAAAAGGSIFIIILLIYKFDIHRICKLLVTIRGLDRIKEKYPELPETISIKSI